MDSALDGIILFLCTHEWSDFNIGYQLFTPKEKYSNRNFGYKIKDQRQS